jgi:hypothetical protein
MRWTRIIVSVMMVLFLSACASDAPTVPVGPVLLEQHTLEPTLSVPTRIASGDLPDDLNNTRDESLQTEPSSQVEFIFTTPTIPPTKTPTPIPSPIPTETALPIVIPTEIPRPTVALFPTSVIIPVAPPTIAPIVVAPINPNPPLYGNQPSYGIPVDPSGIQQPIVIQPTSAVAPICNTRWFFIEPRPLSCPVAMPIVGQGVYQPFENGQMIWVSALGAIYVIYNDMHVPRWQVFRDDFQEGITPEQDPQFVPPSPNRWQPRRGFGLVWRNNETVRARLGWAIQDSETSYEMRIQQSDDNTLFMTDPTNYLYGLFYGGIGWQRYPMIVDN